MKKLFLSGFVLLGSLAYGATPKTVGDLNVDGQTITINGVVNYYPSTAAAATTIAVRSSTGAITYQNAVTDPVREGSNNVFTSSNVINNYGLVFEQITSEATPPSGYRTIFAKSDGFYQKDS